MKRPARRVTLLYLITSILIALGMALIILGIFLKDFKRDIFLGLGTGILSSAIVSLYFSILEEMATKEKRVKFLTMFGVFLSQNIWNIYQIQIHLVNQNNHTGAGGGGSTQDSTSDKGLSLLSFLSLTQNAIVIDHYSRSAIASFIGKANKNACKIIAEFSYCQSDIMNLKLQKRIYSYLRHYHFLKMALEENYEGINKQLSEFIRDTYLLISQHKQLKYFDEIQISDMATPISYLRRLTEVRLDIAMLLDVNDFKQFRENERCLSF